MTGNVRQTAPKLTWGTLRVTCDNSPTSDGTGPQNGPEGTEDMKSIDNLREYVLTAPSICSTTRAILVGYIDGIEREVKELRDREYRNGVEDGKMAAEREVKELADERDLLKRQWEAGVDFDQRLEACADKREDVTLWGVDYMPYPLDAEGVPIRVGDWVDVGDGKQRVEAVTPDAVYWWEEDGCHWVRAHMVTRHHAPTVEDVLAEMLDVWGELPSNVTNEAIIAEYAAKLALRGDE